MAHRLLSKFHGVQEVKCQWIKGTFYGLLLVGAYPAQTKADLFLLRWMETPAWNGPSTQAKPEDRTEFLPVSSFDKDRHDDQSWPAVRQNLKEGDMIAYKTETWKAVIEVFFKGGLNRFGYMLFKYGHMAIVVKDPNDENRLRLLSSWSLKGPNILEDLDTMKYHSWDSYRLNQWDRVDKKRFYEFVSIVRQKAESWTGYDFSGMFGLWNSNLQPSKPEEIGLSYTCSTVILAALYYAGVELDAYQRYGIADIVTPLQVVSSKGRIVPVPEVIFEAASEPEGLTATSGDSSDQNSIHEESY